VMDGRLFPWPAQHQHQSHCMRRLEERRRGPSRPSRRSTLFLPTRAHYPGSPMASSIMPWMVVHPIPIARCSDAADRLSWRPSTSSASVTVPGLGDLFQFRLSAGGVRFVYKLRHPPPDRPTLTTKTAKSKSPVRLGGAR
jgi:hypothetical protein